MNAQTSEKPQTAKSQKQVKAAKEEKPVAKSYADFLTRPIANEGVEIPLFNAEGKKTGHWLRVVGEDSDIFREGQTKLYRTALKNSELPEEEADSKFGVVSLEVLASCIIDWSFEEAPTLDEKVSLLKDAPRIKDKIEEVITSKSLFIKKKPTS